MLKTFMTHLFLICILMLTIDLISDNHAIAQSTDAVEVSQNFDVEAETQKYIGRLDGEALEKSDNYFEGGYWLQLWNLFYGIAVAWLLLSKGLSHKMRDLSEKVTSRIFIQNTAYIAQYLILTTVLTFPLTIYQDFFREHSYGLSNMTFAEWFGEFAIGLSVSLVVLSLLFAVIYKIIRKLKATWVTWASLISIGFLVFILLLSPILIQPLFNEYKVMESGQMRDEILSLARANSIPATDVFQMDSSKQSKRISANVSGLGATTRISLNDNLINRSDLAGVRAVMGHEMGHYALNHSYKMLIIFSLIIYIGFSFVRWAFNRFNKSEWNINGVGDIAGFPLFMVLFSVYFFFATPITNTVIRVNEVEADLYGLNAAREPDGFAETILSLSEYRKVKPGYWEEIIFFDHPSGYSRIKMAMQWQKENPGVGMNSVAIIPEKK